MALIRMYLHAVSLKGGPAAPAEEGVSREERVPPTAQARRSKHQRAPRVARH